MLPLAREARAAKGRTMKTKREMTVEDFYTPGAYIIPGTLLVSVFVTVGTWREGLTTHTSVIMYLALAAAVIGALLFLAPHRPQKRDESVVPWDFAILFIGTIVALLAALLLGFWWHAFMALLPIVVTFIISRLRLKR